THQAMGELVASLEERGYLERRPDPADRRARLICFTPRGRTLMRLALAELAEIESTWLRQVEQEPRADLRAALANAANGAGRAGDEASAAAPPRRRNRWRQEAR
ncbi:MAG TPA: MarR family transcriptional regulator, partial [Thermomicrobiales bacterium]|nr:MarR family transcriptional regulator [Thermomicrobiales bacterium]